MPFLASIEYICSEEYAAHPEGCDVKEKKPTVKVVKVTMERHIPLTEKTCPQCGRRFMGVKIQKYCSKRCSNLAAYWRNPEAYRKHSLESRGRRRKEQTGKR